MHIGKVVSHQDLKGAKDEAESWIFRGNAAADRVASTAFQRFPELMKTWEQLYHDVVSVGILRDQVHKVIVQVGLHSFTKPAEKLDKPPVQARIARGEVVPFQPTEVDCSNLARRWNFPEA